MELPRELITGKRREPPRRLLGWLAVALALVCGWEVLGLPGGCVVKYKAPADMQWVGQGFKKVLITADGTWGINRYLYADRQQYYEITPTGALFVSTERSNELSSADISGIPHGGNTMFDDGTLIRVKPGTDVKRWMRAMGGRVQSDDSSAQSQASDAATSAGHSGAQDSLDKLVASERLPDWHRDTEFGGTGIEHVDSADLMISTAFGSVVLDYVLQGSGSGQAELLPGHHYLGIVDSFAVIEPDVWLTTDRLRWLHHLRIERQGTELVIHELASAPLALDNSAIDRNCIVGLDPLRSELFLLLPTGERIWFDPESLDELERDQLPGNWEAEYAALIPFGGTHSVYQGIPLTRQAYNWLMQGLMVVFMGSLLWLLIQWRQAWKHILEPTTAAVDSKEPSASTSEPGDAS